MLYKWPTKVYVAPCMGENLVGRRSNFHHIWQRARKRLRNTARPIPTLRFAVVAGLTAMALTASLSPLAAAAIRESVIDRQAHQVADQVRGLSSPPFTRAEFDRGLEPSRQVFFDALFSDRKHTNLLRIRLWSRSGILLYSNDDFGVGRNFPISSGLRAALDGSVAVEPAASQLGPFSTETMYLSRQGYLRYLDFQNKQVWINSTASAVSATRARSEPAASGPEGAQPGVVRLFVPVTITGSAIPTGAFEVLYDFRPVERRLAHIHRTVWAVAPSGFLVFCFGLFALMQVTSRTSLRHDGSLRATHLGTFRALASAVDARDSGTGDHSGRVAAYAVAIARRLGLSSAAITELDAAARLHDIGKIGVPDDVLMKPGRLTSSQWELMRQHAVVGSSILSSAPLSKAIKEAVRHVHEWWDGRGYPDQLKGDQIPVFARILAVADAFEAMTSGRPYRRALSPEEALAELLRMRGVQFDPTIVDAFCTWAETVDLGEIVQ